MEKLLNLTKRQTIGIAWAAVAVGIAGMLAMGAAASDQLRQVEAIHDHAPTAPADVEVNKAEEKEPQPVVTKTEPSKPTYTPVGGGQEYTPAEPKQETEPAKKEPGGHIPFTSKPVTPGDPESYVDTVGQCPFYEMAGPKGCVPPPDIICNDDWTVCKPVEKVLDKVGL